MTAEMMKKRKQKLLLGLIAGILLMLSDLLWQARGDIIVSTNLGAFADKAWLALPTWRIVLSELLTAATVPLYYIGFTEMYRLIREHARNKKDVLLSKLFRVGMLAGTMGFLFIHMLCLNMPLIMQAVAPFTEIEKAAEITNRIMMVNITPMILYFLAADGVLTAAMALLVLKKTLPVNRLALLCNPIVTAVLARIIAMLPWPFNQVGYTGEAFGHLLIIVVGLIVTAKDEKMMPKRRKKPQDDRPVMNLDDEPDADVTII